MDDTLLIIGGSEYKVGLRGYVFTLICDEWQRSSVTIDELRDEWAAQFSARIGRPVKTRVPTEEKAKKAYYKKVRARLDRHIKKAEPYLKSGTWKKIPPGMVVI